MYSTPEFVMLIPSTDPTFPDITGNFGYSDVYSFYNTGGQFIGALMTQMASTPGSSYAYYEIRTIDLTTMQSGNDPVATQIVSDALSASATDSTLASNINLLNSNPASVVEYSSDPTLGVGWGRWANGNVLTVYADTGGSALTSRVDTLTNNQSAHFIFGPKPPVTLPSVGNATFDFLGGTQSTSLGGTTIGQGVTSGSINFDFATSYGTFTMDINHNNAQYSADGSLIAASFPANAIAGGGSVYTSASTSYCVDGCGISILGGFAGADTSGNPQFLNISYVVDESDPIIGVASFKFASITTPTSTVIPVGGLAAVLPKYNNPTVADITLGNAGYGFLDSSNQLVGILFTNTLNGSRDFGTTNLDAVLGGDNATAVSEVQTLYNAAPNASSAAIAAAALPATLADFQYNATDGIGWGRWTNGSVLTFDDSGGPAESHYLSGNQSIHFIFGPSSPSISGLTSTATYNFMGGTHSTSLSGSTIGNGVTSGTIMVDFSLADASLSMSVDHAPYTYNINSGSLTINPDDTLTGVVTASSSSSTCTSCNVNIDGGFAGPATSTMEPKYIGIQYSIQEPDVITGVAGFQNATP